MASSAPQPITCSPITAAVIAAALAHSPGVSAPLILLMRPLLMEVTLLRAPLLLQVTCNSNGVRYRLRSVRCRPGQRGHTVALAVVFRGRTVTGTCPGHRVSSGRRRLPALGVGVGGGAGEGGERDAGANHGEARRDPACHAQVRGLAEQPDADGDARH